eukprot:c46241_g1_i1.p1 GENE.c46241_g1_i1~~c46241_g1_i1.p1  ORF type:complete len:138 (-),score=18.80 c46241_g1_i1:17-430(-)
MGIAEKTQEMTEQGFQGNSGPYWCAVANTRYGTIPGKAKDGTCWYAYGGKEFNTTSFSIVTDQYLVSSPDSPAHAFQTDGAGSHWCAIAFTEYGNIPGKANAGGCWYSYGGKEYHLEPESGDYKFVCPHSEFVEDDE